MKKYNFKDEDEDQEDSQDETTENEGKMPFDDGDDDVQAYM